MTRMTMLGSAALIAAGLGLATAASAAPLSPAPLGASEGEGTIQKVYGGCGWGRHPNGFGYCVPNANLLYGRPVYRPYGYYAPPPPPPPIYRPYGYYGPRPFY